MADERLEIVRQAYERWAQGDFTSAEIFHPDVEVVWDRHMPERGTDRGIEAFGKSFFASFADIRELRIACERIELVGDSVVVAAAVTGVGRASGAPVRMLAGHIWEMEDGRARRVTGFIDAAAAFEAARKG